MSRHPVDTTVTADIRRTFDAGILHGTTKWRCTRISRGQLFRPLKYWIGDVDRGKMAKKMPYFEYSLRSWLRKSTHGFRNLFRPRKHSKPRNQTLPTQPSSETTTLQVSTQVVGTKSRNVFCVWLKENTSDKRMKKIAAKLAVNGLGPVHRFSDGERISFFLFSNSKRTTAKILRELNFNRQSGELHRLSHHWVNLYELQEEGEHQPPHAFGKTGGGGDENVRSQFQTVI